jgi:hypothetical protein
MNRLIVILWFLAAGALPKASAEAHELPRTILGIQLNITKDEAHKRLEKIGNFVREEEHQEVWQVRDESFSHLIVGFDKDEKVRYVTAVAREDKGAKRVEYEKIGDLKKARQAGDPKVKNFNYQWDVPATKEQSHMLVLAAGRDPKFLTTFSLKNPNAQKEED